MQIQILAHGIVLDEVLREYIEKKISPLSKFLKRMEASGELLCQVELSRATLHHRSGDIYYAEITLPLLKKTLRAENYHKDIQSAITRARRVLKEEILRYKEQYTTKKK